MTTESAQAELLSTLMQQYTHTELQVIQTYIPTKLKLGGKLYKHLYLPYSSLAASCTKIYIYNTQAELQVI